MSDIDEKPEGCDFCGFKTELKLYENRSAKRPRAWLCNICASTAAGNAYQFPGHYENEHILKQISYCTNLILSALVEEIHKYFVTQS